MAAAPTEEAAAVRGTTTADIHVHQTIRVRAAHIPPLRQAVDAEVADIVEAVRAAEAAVTQVAAVAAADADIVSFMTKE